MAARVVWTTTTTTTKDIDEWTIRNGMGAPGFILGIFEMDQVRPTDPEKGMLY
ncbi:hypothetical protein PHLCEN_2v9920 [Hermanssonia centrifuga]|uniref:Uncharacterized protein n=1 Tax=Hermanssonia centrifuga TaxID=98765 RepID=A0A2R6NPC8_9APHY|nr:hypothetical protein PHLCEN_2v9920 [Hermanssonia centrifuga]